MAKPSPAGDASARRVTSREHLLGYLQVTHPLPSAMYVVGTALLSAVAATATHRSLDGGALARALIGRWRCPGGRRLLQRLPRSRA